VTFLVPYDGSYLSNAALTRATEYAEALDEDVVAVTVIPEDHKGYAIDKNWLDEDEEFDVQTITSSVHEQVVEIAPRASFRHERSPTSALRRSRPRSSESPTTRFRRSCSSEATTRAAS